MNDDHGKEAGGSFTYTVQLLLMPHWPRREDLKRGGPGREISCSCRRCMDTKRINTGPHHRFPFPCSSSLSSLSPSRNLGELWRCFHLCGISQLQPLRAVACGDSLTVLHRKGKNAKGEGCLALCGAVPVLRAAASKKRAFFASKAVNKVRRETTEETTNKQRRRRLTLICCLRDVALDHAGIDAAMDEGLLQLPQVGGRRLEVPAQAVAHRAHQSSPVSASSSYSRAAAAICSEKATQAR
jgi:hypothetical protein